MTKYTSYQDRYFAEQLLLKRPQSSYDSLASAMSGVKVDLNPHQVDAALFAMQSPLSSGVLMADEVGLGKTIEAGLVLAQYWAERKRNILLIVPAALRTQWRSELSEKFYIDSLILESSNFNKMRKEGCLNPFDAKNQVVICSYNFAANKDSFVHAMPWDLVVLDEAHRLRNVYKPQNVTANKLKNALKGRKKLLLTATPLQNNLMELYGLVSFIDEHNSFIYVTTQFLTTELLDGIAADVDEFEHLLICAPAFDTGLNKRYENITVRKIPQSVLNKCEYGVDNYDLNIIDPPELDEEEWEDA